MVCGWRRADGWKGLRGGAGVSPAPEFGPHRLGFRSCPELLALVVGWPGTFSSPCSLG